MRWNRKTRTSKLVRGASFYWQDDTKTLQAFVEIMPVKLTKINEFYLRNQLNKTRSIVGKYFLERNIPRLILATDAGGNRLYHWIVEKILDDRDTPDLHIWNWLITFPPTHTIVVGRIFNGKKKESTRLTISLRHFELFETPIVYRSGRLIAHLLQSQSDLQFLLTPNPSNAELWLLCVFVNIKKATSAIG